MNQKTLNVIESFKADAERFSRTLESRVVEVAGIIREFNAVADTAGQVETEQGDVTP
jgi:hypothetical protein